MHFLEVLKEAAKRCVNLKDGREIFEAPSMFFQVNFQSQKTAELAEWLLRNLGGENAYAFVNFLEEAESLLDHYQMGGRASDDHSAIKILLGRLEEKDRRITSLQKVRGVAVRARVIEVGREIDESPESTVKLNVSEGGAKVFARNLYRTVDMDLVFKEEGETDA